MTIDAAADDTNTLTLDGCTITFQYFGTGDTDCTDGVGMIDLLANGVPASQATALAGFTFPNYIASAGTSGKFILTHTGVAVDGNIASIETGTLVISDVNTVVGAASPIAQVVHFTPVNPTV